MKKVDTIVATAIAALMALAASSALGASAEGVWVTQPDKKGGFAHIQAHSCGAALCGTVLRAFDSEGREITTPNVGKRVFWDMRPVADGRYKGRAWVPAHGREYDGVMKVSGDRMKVSGCLGPVCQSQTWRRVK